MSLSNQITPLILTFNEAPNIGRTLAQLTWAKQIVVVDSFSTDKTLDIVSGFPQAKLVQRTFDSFAGQCNFGLRQIKTDWVLSLDADYVLSEGLVTEIQDLPLDEQIAGYSARFNYCICGKPLRATLYPPRIVLYRRERAHYRDEGHGHRVQVDGATQMLFGWINHDDRKSLDRWFSEQNRYAAIEARHLLESPKGELRLPDRLRRRIVLAPVLMFFYTLFAKGLILDGWPGWFYVLQRTLAEIMLSLRLIEAKLQSLKPNQTKSN